MTDSAAGREEVILHVLQLAGVDVGSVAGVEGLSIPREILVRPGAYTEVAKVVPTLKSHFSSTYMTCLQDEAPGGQRWPLLNLVRQVLKASGFNMVPRRVSDGYGPDKRKRYKRVFDVTRAAK
tara:strand:+ start:528 stop:896 length:369 start_codon:yes stop_codon:yes gene_type:complete